MKLSTVFKKAIKNLSLDHESYGHRYICFAIDVANAPEQDKIRAKKLLQNY